MTRLPHFDALDQHSPDETAVERARHSSAAPPGAEETYVVPASLEQGRYWTLAQIDSGSTASNMAISCEIAGPLDPLLTEQAIAALTLRHEALRTLFRIVDGHLSQVILTRPLYEFTQQDLSHAGHSALLESDLAAALSAHSHVHIDLEHGPVLRARLLRLAKERHVLAITMSHIVCDGWSNGVLLRDFIRMYHALQVGAGTIEGIAAGHASGLPELPFHFADFTVWQNEYLAGEQARTALQFWTSHIPRDLPALDMPADRPRKAGRSFPGTIASALLPASLNDALVAYCRSTGSTKHIVLLACFEAVCARFSGQKRFLLGSTIANRTQPGMENIVGRFANPQIIVADVEGNPTFRELEARVRDWETSAYTHQDMPFSRIIEEFQMSQEGAGSQFLQVWFVYQKAFMQPQEIAGLRLDPLRSVSGGVDFDLLVSVVERAEGPRLQIEYNTDLFSSERIEGLLSAFQQTLAAVLANPDLPMSQVALTSVVPAPAFPVPVPSEVAPANLLGAIAHHAATRPNAIAIRAGAHQLTWRELQERSAILATRLVRQGDLDAKIRAWIVLTPQIESAIALLALLRLGEDAPRITPLPAHTRIENLPLTEISASLLLAPLSQIREVAAPAIRTVAYEDIAALPPLSTAAASGILPQYWSAPKAVDSRDQNGGFVTNDVSLPDTLRSIAALAGQLHLCSADAVLAVPPASAADAFFDLLLGLYSGVTLDLAPFRSDAALQQLLNERQISVAIAEPAQWRTWAANGWNGDRRLTAVARGRHAAQPDWAGENVAVSSRIAILSGPSGPLATTVEAPEFSPLPGIQLSVVDLDGIAAPFGATGELVAGSQRTGFLAQSTSSGTVRILGTTDSVVHLHAHRVRLTDLEHALLGMPGVFDVTVRLQQREDGTPQIAAWTVGSDELDVAQLRNSLIAILPQHLIPATLQVVQAFSLRADGSVDTSQLAVKAAPAAALENTSSAKDDDVSREVSHIWKEVLNLDAVDPNVPFFEAGGNSLLLVRLFARLNKSFGTRLPITTIFDAATVSGLSERLRNHADIRALVPVQPHGDRPPVFMIHSYLLYQALSQSLGESQPFYGLRELETDSELAMQQRVANYVREIRSVQPHGPYSVMGWCAAGPLTVEVARSLIEAGESVTSVILFDSWLPGYLNSVEGTREHGVQLSRWRTLRNKLRRHNEKMRTLSMAQRLQYLRAAVARYALSRRNRFFIRHWSNLNILATRFRLPLPQFMYNTTLTTFAAMSAYHPQQVTVRLNLIRAHDSREILGASPGCGWEQVATQGVEVLWAPGDHETMFLGENLQATTALIRHCLEGSQRESTSTYVHGAVEKNS